MFQDLRARVIGDYRLKETQDVIEALRSVGFRTTSTPVIGAWPGISRYITTDSGEKYGCKYPSLTYNSLHKFYSLLENFKLAKLYRLEGLIGEIFQPV